MKQEFTAVLQQHEGINGAYITPPFDVYQVYGAGRVKVRATFDGVPYRGSIVRMGGCFMLGVPQEIRKQIGKDFGESVFVTVEKDEEERTVLLPVEFKTALEQHPAAAAFYETLSYTGKRDYARYIEEAKKESTRQARIEKSIVQLSQGKRLK